MNAFANWLFTLLLGWTGGMANRAWNTVVNASGGISDFFSRYWLLLVVGLILLGTVMDYAVWLVRWRPYLVWRSWLRRLTQRRAHRKANESLRQTEMDDQTLNTIADWVATPQEQYPVYELESAEAPIPYAPEAAVQDPAWTYEEPEQPFFVESQAEPVYDPAMFQPAPRLFHQDGEATEPMPYGAWATREQAQPQPEPQGPARRRRSDRGKGRTLVNRLADLREKLSSDDREEGMLDGLPAPVRQQDAFHDAVYPKSYQRPQPPIAPWPDDSQQEQEQ